mmetsp:Transcript_22037/g.28230  ORF Transcript_22037/g.28230 Transcript_22037/m.28230 type:complete len:207 (+) Transcript_22037:112-732(+)
MFLCHLYGRCRIPLLFYQLSDRLLQKHDYSTLYIINSLSLYQRFLFPALPSSLRAPLCICDGCLICFIMLLPLCEGGLLLLVVSPLGGGFIILCFCGDCCCILALCFNSCCCCSFFSFFSCNDEKTPPTPTVLPIPPIDFGGNFICFPPRNCTSAWDCFALPVLPLLARATDAPKEELATAFPNLEAVEVCEESVPLDQAEATLDS